MTEWLISEEVSDQNQKIAVSFMISSLPQHHIIRVLVGGHIRPRVGLGRCCVELHHGAIFGEKNSWPSLLRNLVITNKSCDSVNLVPRVLSYPREPWERGCDSVPKTVP